MTVMALPDAQQLLAMPDSDYMNSVQRAFSVSCCRMSGKSCCCISMS